MAWTYPQDEGRFRFASFVESKADRGRVVRPIWVLFFFFFEVCVFRKSHETAHHPSSPSSRPEVRVGVSSRSLDREEERLSHFEIRVKKTPPSCLCAPARTFCATSGSHDRPVPMAHTGSYATTTRLRFHRVPRETRWCWREGLGTDETRASSSARTFPKSALESCTALTSSVQPSSNSSRDSPTQSMTLRPASSATRVFNCTAEKLSANRFRRSLWPTSAKEAPTLVTILRGTHFATEKTRNVSSLLSRARVHTFVSWVLESARVLKGVQIATLRSSRCRHAASEGALRGQLADILPASFPGQRYLQGGGVTHSATWSVSVCARVSVCVWTRWGWSCEHADGHVCLGERFDGRRHERRRREDHDLALGRVCRHRGRERLGLESVQSGSFSFSSLFPIKGGTRVRARPLST